MLLTLHIAEAQETNTSKFDKNKLIYGGDIGFSFSNTYWSVGASPQIGYKFFNQFHAGAGLGYRYGQSRNDYYDYTENGASFNLFGNYYPWKSIILSIKPEIMYTWYKSEYEGYKYSTDKFIPTVVVGFGLHLKPIILQLNYELIQNEYSPYSNSAFFSLGFMF